MYFKYINEHFIKINITEIKTMNKYLYDNSFGDIRYRTMFTLYHFGGIMKH